MEKINIQERQPKLGDKILAYGVFNGEIYGKDDDKDWYFVEYLGNLKGQGIGGEYYGWSVEDIEYWIELNLD